MQRQEFVTAYSRTVQEPLPNLCSDLVKPAEVSSREFGDALYEWLDRPGRALPANGLSLDDYFDRYQLWQDEHLRKILKSLIRLRPESVEDMHAVRQGLNRLNFHVLNQCLKPMWRPILEGTYPKDIPRDRLARRAQENLGVAGMNYLLLRKHLMGERAAREYSEEERSIKLAGLNGMIGEIGVGIVGVGAVRLAMRVRPQLTLGIVPAPYYFEHGIAQDLNPNIDLLLYSDTDDEVLGIQAKQK